MSSVRVLIVMCCIIMTFNLALAQNSPQDFLNAQNPSRAEVGLPPLAWNKTLAAYAQSYANVRSDCALIHSEGPYGENIAWAGWDISAKETVDFWISEKPYYDYNLNSCIGDQQCRHYTQVVWCDTTSVGCGRSHCKNGNTFVSCNYWPPGNWVVSRPY